MGDTEKASADELRLAHHDAELRVARTRDAHEEAVRYAERIRVAYRLARKREEDERNE